MLSLSPEKKDFICKHRKREQKIFFIIIIYDAPFHSLIMLHYEHEEKNFFISLADILLQKSRREYCKRYFMDI
jgi:hypothetical protein